MFHLFLIYSDFVLPILYFVELISIGMLIDMICMYLWFISQEIWYWYIGIIHINSPSMIYKQVIEHATMIRNTFDQMTCCMHYGIINTVKIDGCDYLCEDNAFTSYRFEWSTYHLIWMVRVGSCIGFNLVKLYKVWNGDGWMLLWNDVQQRYAKLVRKYTVCYHTAVYSWHCILSSQSYYLLCKYIPFSLFTHLR